MRNELVAVLVVLTMLAAAAAGALLSGANPRTVTIISTTTTTTTASYQTPCSSPVSPTTTAGRTDVYEVSPGSLGIICVNYHFDNAGNWSFTSPDYGPLNYSSRSVGFSSCLGGGTLNGTASTSCSTLRITSSTGEFSHAGDQNVTVAYAIAAEKNATGLFWLFIGVCDPIYLAIGSIPASVPRMFLSCISVSGQPSYEAVTGVSNINFSVVPLG